MLIWLPRLAASLVAAFLAVFALDAFRPGQAVTRTLLDVSMHLVPSIVVCLIVAGAWRRPWIGALAFAAIGTAYAIAAFDRLDWVLVVSGPMFVVAAMFLLSWALLKRPSTATQSPRA